MFKPTRSVPAFLMAIGLSMAASACASQGRYYGNTSARDTRAEERRAYDIGYRQGVSHGENDARDRRTFRVDRDRDYRNERGYYRGVFQDGYRAGYTEGYNRVARSGRNRYPVYPGDRSSGGPVFGGPGGSRVTGSPATQNGYRDGLEAGRDDARDGDSFEPRRSKRYREGDNDYEDRYGSRDQYKQEYRAAFQRGYEQGYRDSRR